MFESAELQHEVAKATYQREEARLRAALLDAQYDLKLDGRFPVLILIAGVEGAGKGETVNLLNEWMDPRHIQTTAFGPPSDEEIERPAHWRFWTRAAAEGSDRHLLRCLAHDADPAARDGRDRQRRLRQSPSARSSAWRRCCATRACCS